jgi:hypothetical protein
LELSLGRSSRAVRAGLVLAVLAGIALRMLAATRGFNRDVVNYARVAAIAHKGLNVYAVTSDFNYGPLWFHVLHALRDLTRGDPDSFRLAVAGLLTLADIGIFLVLAVRLSTRVALLFLFNPVSILITGYHSQFDNLALLLGMLSVLLLERREEPRRLASLALLGLSLTLKHVLFAFPLWIAARETTWRRRAEAIAVPWGLFLLSFAPYWARGSRGIVENVFLYQSWPRPLLARWLLPDDLFLFVSPSAIWLCVLGIGAFFDRRRALFETLLVYTAVLVAFSPAMVNQYLAIAVPFAAAFLNPFLVAYSALGALHILGDADGLGLPEARRLFRGSPSALPGPRLHALPRTRLGAGAHPL